MDVYERDAEAVLVFLARRTLDVEVALDLAAETFAQAWRGWSRVRVESRAEVRAFLFTIARRQLGRYLRRGRVEQRALGRLGVEMPEVHDGDLDEIEQAAGLAQLRIALGVELAALSGDQRRALQLRIVEEMPYPEVAQRLGVSEPLRVRASRAAFAGSRARSNRPPRPKEADREPANPSPSRPRARARAGCACGTGRLGSTRRRPVVAAVVVAVLAFAAAALAASGVFSTGAAVTPGSFGDLTSRHSGGGGVLPRSALGIAAQGSDPAGGPAWGMRAVRTTRGLACIQIGRVVAGRLGVLGQDGAFANDKRFHPLPPQVVENPVDCAPPDAHGQLYLSFASQGVPASASAAGCTPPGDVELHPNPPICSQTDERAVYAGLLGPLAASVTYATPDGHEQTVPVGPGGAYIIVLPADPVRDQGGSNRSGLLPSQGNAQPIRRITYQRGAVSDITTNATTAGNGRPCTPAGYAAPTLRIPPQRLVSARVSYTRRINIRVPGHSGREDDLDVTFTARVAVTRASSAYTVSLQLPKTGACRGMGTGTVSNQDITAGEHVHLHMTWAAYADSPLRCPGAYSGTVYYAQSTNSSGGGPLLGSPPGTPGTSRVAVGHFAFNLK